MVEHGVVKLFFGRGSHNKGKYGFIRVLDKHGKLTDEEVFFHAGKFSHVSLNLDSVVVFTTFKSLRAEPHKGSKVVFERENDVHGRPHATHWSYQYVWDDVAKRRFAQRDIAWRIVLNGYADDDEHRIATVLSGTHHGTLASVRALTAASLQFYHNEWIDSLCQGYDSYYFYLLVKQDKEWLTVKELTPLSNSRKEDDESDFGPCRRCHGRLTESEYALGDICDGCRPASIEEWQNRQDAAAEAAEERRRYPEESDDDYEECGRAYS